MPGAKGEPSSTGGNQPIDWLQSSLSLSDGESVLGLKWDVARFPHRPMRLIHPAWASRPPRNSLVCLLKPTGLSGEICGVVFDFCTEQCLYAFSSLMYASLAILSITAFTILSKRLPSL